MMPKLHFTLKKKRLALIPLVFPVTEMAQKKNVIYLCLEKAYYSK